MSIRSLAIAVLLALPLTVVHASVYKWEDADGTTVYGSNPPPDVDAVPMDGATGTVRDDDGNGNGDDDTEAESAEATEPDSGDESVDAGEEDADDGHAQVMAEQCDAAEETVDVLSDPSVRRIQEGDGEAEVLTDEDREQRLGEAQDFLDEFC